jgi:hypothetical protein
VHVAKRDAPAAFVRDDGRRYVEVPIRSNYQLAGISTHGVPRWMTALA